MSLTNPNTPISQQDLQDFYHKLLPYMGGSSGGQTIQVETLPTASADELGNVYQYIGTTGTYTHGFFYECVSDGESTPTYSWEQTSVQPSTSGGHTIEDSEGTDLTQRDTLQFGEGFLAEDDDTNEKTVISPNVMRSGDMSDVITPLPSVAPKKEGVKYSTTEQVIGEWIDGKPLYQKSYVGKFGTITDGTEAQLPIDVTSLNIDIGFIVNGFIKSTTGNVQQLNDTYGNTSQYRIRATISELTTLYVFCNRGVFSNADVYVTLQYTKTTDTPNI